MKIWMLLILVITSMPFIAANAFAQQDFNGRLNELELRLDELEHEVKTVEADLETLGEAGLLLFLFGAFCALWAQNTDRNAWLWFFFGLFFHVITVLLLLYKHSNDRKRNAYERRLEERFERLNEEYQRELRKMSGK